eukprot:gene2690-14902_t
MGSSGVMQLVRAFSSSSAAAMSVASPLAVKSGGGFGAIFGISSARLDVPLSQPLSVPQPLRSTVPTTAPKMESSVVEGVTVSSIDSLMPITSVAVIVPGGSAYETETTVGASKVLQELAFKSTTNRTTFSIARELEKLGATATVCAGRESIGFSIDATRIHSNEATELLLDSILNARFNYWEVAEAVAAVKSQMVAQMANPAVVMSELMHRTAFEGGLSNTLVNDPSVLDGFTNETLKEYASGLFSSSGMILAGVGVSHGDFTAVARSLLPSSAGAVAAPASSYTGGFANVVGSCHKTHISLSFEAKGGLSDAKTVALSSVTAALLDSSKAITPWSTSKGMTGFSTLHKSTGLVGIMGSTTPSTAGALVDILCQKLEDLSKGPADGALKAAKAATLNSHMASLSTSSGAIALMGPALLASGKFNSAEFVSAVLALSSADIATFISKSLKSPTLKAQKVQHPMQHVKDLSFAPLVIILSVVAWEDFPSQYPLQLRAETQGPTWQHSNLASLRWLLPSSSASSSEARGHGLWRSPTAIYVIGSRDRPKPRHRMKPRYAICGGAIIQEEARLDHEGFHSMPESPDWLMRTEYTRSIVTFDCSNGTCEGWLYEPKPAVAEAETETETEQKQDETSCIIMAHGLGGQKDMGLHNYAHEFVTSGFTVLIFDYRSFGGSSGSPRHYASPYRNLDDWDSALLAMKEPSFEGHNLKCNQMYLWGTSYSGGHVLVMAEKHPKDITAVVSQVPYLSAKAASKASIQQRGIPGSLKILMDMEPAYMKLDMEPAYMKLDMEPAYVRLVGRPGDLAIMLLPEDQMTVYFSKHPKVYLGGWKPYVLGRLLIEMMTYSPIHSLQKEMLQTPVLMLSCSSDHLCAPDVVRKAHSLLGPASELLEFECSHFDIYGGKLFKKASRSMIDFFKKHSADAMQS